MDQTLQKNKSKKKKILVNTPILRRSSRERRKLKIYSPLDFHSNFGLFVIDDDPRTLREAVDLEDGKLWKNSMIEEITSLDKNESWDLVEFSNRLKIIGNEWVFKNNMNIAGKVEK
jgi:hypothetical protein